MLWIIRIKNCFLIINKSHTLRFQTLLFSVIIYHLHTLTHARILSYTHSLSLTIYHTHSISHTHSHTLSHTHSHTLTLYLSLSLSLIHIIRNANESINDANDRAIRSCCKYFQRVIQGHGQVIMISNDTDNKVM